MIRVLEVVGRMDRAGQETFLMNIFREADKRKYEISFAVNTNYIGAYESEIEALSGKIYHNPCPADLPHLLKYLGSFKKILKEEGPFDVIHCHVWLFGGFILWAARKEGIPIRIMHSHNTNDGYKNTLQRMLYRKIASSLIKRNATKFVACGKDAYQALFQDECPDSNHILNNAINTHLFNEEQFDCDSIKKTLNIQNDCAVITSVARFCDVKNHPKIISVFEAFLKRYSDRAELLLVGSGELEDAIRELVLSKNIADKVHFLGVRPDVNKLLAISDIFLMPSKFEGLPVSLIEAQASGCQCVISNTITDEVDMQLGLISKLPLEIEDSIWAEKCYEAAHRKKLPFAIRNASIEKCGYTIKAVWRKLDELYK